MRLLRGLRCGLRGLRGEGFLGGKVVDGGFYKPAWLFLVEDNLLQAFYGRWGEILLSCFGIDAGGYIFN